MLGVGTYELMSVFEHQVRELTSSVSAFDRARRSIALRKAAV
jgi:hypothetical protein